MEHVLDNPAWYALNSGNAAMASGTDHVKFFHAEVSPFVAFDRTGRENFELLFTLIAHQNPILLVSPADIEVPAFWKTVAIVPGWQMVFEGDVLAGEGHDKLITLNETHVPQMLELTKLTNPGPFASRTIEFGHYKGIFDGGRLAAMAGQRLQPLPYTEVSAVCTHTDYTGKGYARRLLAYQVNRIKAAGEIPFLHVKGDNERAIRVYESLGFVKRVPVSFYVLKKEA